MRMGGKWSNPTWRKRKSIIGSGWAAKRWPKLYGGLDALPETYLIDREGRIAAHHVGMAPRAEYEKEIVQVLGKVTDYFRPSAIHRLEMPRPKV